MAFATPAQIQDRMVTLAALISGINSASDGWPEGETPFTNAQLPVVVVEMLPIGAPVSFSGEFYTLPLDFLLTVLTDRFPQDTKIRERDSWALLEPFFAAVPSAFKQRPRLENNDTGLAFGLTLPRVQSVGALALDTALYPSITFRMTVHTIQS